MQNRLGSVALISCEAGKKEIGWRKAFNRPLAFHSWDKVITNGGLHGKITGIKETVVTVEIAPKIRVKVSRGSIAGMTKSE